MKILVYLGHPAHFHNYKNTITALKEHGHEVEILIKKKDILEDLLKNAGIPYHNILEEGRTNSKWGIFLGLLKRTIRMNRFCRQFHPDILTGSSVENSWIGPMRHIPVINIGEDDASIVPIYARLTYPGASVILCPDSCSCGKWDYKAVKYHGYQELGYLHPENFTPDKTVANKYIDTEKPYFLMRFSGLKAHHDTGVRGINNQIARKLISLLEPHGNVYITSERPLSEDLEPYRIAINPLDIHHVMAFADIYLGDSQTMAIEAGVLGVPFIRFNDFVGQIGVLSELEDGYKLGFGIKPDQEEKLYETVTSLLNMDNRKEVFQSRRQKMLSESINFADFLTNYIESYPIKKKS
jgi:predicted glycosyltransferase